MYRRNFLGQLLGIATAAGLIGASGCSGGGVLSGEPKKYEGGGPLPEMKEDEIPESPSKSKAKTKGR